MAEGNDIKGEFKKLWEEANASYNEKKANSFESNSIELAKVFADVIIAYRAFILKQSMFYKQMDCHISGKGINTIILTDDSGEIQLVEQLIKIQPTTTITFKFIFSDPFPPVLMPIEETIYLFLEEKSYEVQYVFGDTEEDILKYSKKYNYYLDGTQIRELRDKILDCVQQKISIQLTPPPMNEQ